MQIFNKKSKQIESENQAASNVVVGMQSEKEKIGLLLSNDENSKPKPQTAQEKNTKKLVIILLALLLVLSLSIFAKFAYSYYDKSQPAVKVNNESMTKQQYSAFKSDYAKVNTLEEKQDFNKYIIESLAYRDASKKYNVKYSNIDIDVAKGLRFAGVNGPGIEWQNYVAETDVLKDKLNQTNADNSNVYAYFVFPYSMHFASGYGKKRIDNFGDEAKIKEDRQYAKEQAQIYYDSIKKDNSLGNANSLIEKLIADSKLNFGFSGNNSESFSYYKDGSKTSSTEGRLFSNDNEKQIITNLKDFTEIQTLKRPNVSGLPGYTGEVDIAYYFYAKLKPNNQKAFNYDDFMKNAKVVNNVN